MPTTRHVVLCCRQYKNIDTLDFSDLTPADLAVMKKVREVVAVCECEGVGSAPIFAAFGTSSLASPPAKLRLLGHASRLRCLRLH